MCFTNKSSRLYSIRTNDNAICFLLNFILIHFQDVLLKRIDRVKQQYEEACRIKEINDKRGETVSKIVEDYCSDEEFADFQHFVDMKTQLALTQAEIRDKIKLGEEKLNALTSAHIDWTTLDLSMK